jgi:hypothetical protein
MILLFIYFEIHGRFPTSPLIPYNIKFVQRGFTKLRIICSGLELTLQILSSTRQRNWGPPCRVSAHNTHPSHFLFIQVIFNIPVKKVRSYFFPSFCSFQLHLVSEWERSFITFIFLCLRHTYLLHDEASTHCSLPPATWRGRRTTSLCRHRHSLLALYRDRHLLLPFHRDRHHCYRP